MKNYLCLIGPAVQMMIEVLDRITADTDGYDSYNINHSFDGFQKWIAFEKKMLWEKVFGH